MGVGRRAEGWCSIDAVHLLLLLLLLHALKSGAASAHHVRSCSGGAAVPPDIMSEHAKSRADERWKDADGVM